MATEHRCELVKYKSGTGKGCTAEVLDEVVAEGWRIEQVHPWPIKTGGSPITGDEKVDLGLLVIFSRERVPAGVSCHFCKKDCGHDFYGQLRDRAGNRTGHRVWPTCGHGRYAVCAGCYEQHNGCPACGSNEEYT